jgi:transcriptional regulator with XRE-family HTH domain
MLGETLREVRHQKGWSIEQLSKSSGVPGQLIREIESQSPPTCLVRPTRFSLGRL